jgi:hypothetical protein
MRWPRPPDASTITPRQRASPRQGAENGQVTATSVQLASYEANAAAQFATSPSASDLRQQIREFTTCAPQGER